MVSASFLELSLLILIKIDIYEVIKTVIGKVEVKKSCQNKDWQERL